MYFKFDMFPRKMKKIIILICFFTAVIILTGVYYYNISNLPSQSSKSYIVNYSYGVIIDAGSSGSRVYIYKWPPHSGKPQELLKITPLLNGKNEPIVMKVSPGLSNLADKPHEAAQYIKPLLDLASVSVPKDKHQETPLYIMATAGMRMIKEESRDQILVNIRTFVKLKYNFLFSDNHCKVISGKEEGIYGWIATNYLLGRFNHNHTDGVEIVPIKTETSKYKSSSLHHRKRTVGIIDMGGGSMQIAYEISDKNNFQSDNILEFDLGCTKEDTDHKYKVFVTTFLGFGANAARSRYERMLLYQFMRSETYQNVSTNSTNISIHDPCLHPGLRITSKVKFINDSLGGLNLTASQINEAKSISVSFIGTGYFHQCENRMLSLLDKTECGRKKIVTIESEKDCVMNGRYHPKIDLQHMEFYGFSEFWYSTNDVLGLGGPYKYIKIHSKSVDYCKQNWHAISLLNKKKTFKRLDGPRFRYQCFKAAWLTNVLHSGLNFPQSFSHLISVSEIANTEVQWSLGALIYQTRYFPLRAIEANLNMNKHTNRNTQFSITSIFLLLLFASIILIILYFNIHISNNNDYMNKNDFLTTNRYFRKLCTILNWFMIKCPCLNFKKTRSFNLSDSGPLLSKRYLKVQSTPNLKDWA